MKQNFKNIKTKTAGAIKMKNLKNLVIGLVLTVVSITGLTGFVNTATAAENTVSTVSSVATEYRYEYRRLNSEWVLKFTYRTSDNRLVDIDIIHEDN